MEARLDEMAVEKKKNPRLDEGTGTMNHRRIRTLLFLTILVMAALPLIAALYFPDRAQGTHLDLGIKQSIVPVLNTGSQKIYFGLGFAGAVLLSGLLAVLLSRNIARSYERTFNDLMSHKQKVRYLEEMASWQQLARILAHEIKNPLNPIEVLVSSLSRAHTNKSERDFHEQLQHTRAMVAEELSHLKNIVNKFSEFSRLPSIRLVRKDLPGLTAQLVKGIAATFEGADIDLFPPAPTPALHARLDPTLFRQVLTNIVRNGVEANPGRRVQFAVRIAADDHSSRVSISNDGLPVPRDLVSRIFEPYVSGKAHRNNMGLGLAIVRKIVIEHGGEIEYAEEGARPVFTIALPRVR